MVSVRELSRDIAPKKEAIYLLEVNGKTVMADCSNDRIRLDYELSLTQDEENAALNFASKLGKLKIERSVYP